MLNKREKTAGLNTKVKSSDLQSLLILASLTNENKSEHKSKEKKREKLIEDNYIHLLHII